MCNSLVIQQIIRQFLHFSFHGAKVMSKYFAYLKQKAEWK